MVSLVVVVIDEGVDLTLEIAWQVIVVLTEYVWPAPSASSFSDLVLPVCINVSGLWAAPAKMESRGFRSS